METSAFTVFRLSCPVPPCCPSAPHPVGGRVCTGAVWATVLTPVPLWHIGERLLNRSLKIRVLICKSEAQSGLAVESPQDCSVVFSVLQGHADPHRQPCSPLCCFPVRTRWSSRGPQSFPVALTWFSLIRVVAILCVTVMSQARPSSLAICGRGGIPGTFLQPAPPQGRRPRTPHTLCPSRPWPDSFLPWRGNRGEGGRAGFSVLFWPLACWVGQHFPARGTSPLALVDCPEPARPPSELRLKGLPS